MNKKTVVPNNNQFVDIDAANKKNEQLRKTQAVQKYIQQLKKYNAFCLQIIVQRLINSFGIPDVDKQSCIKQASAELFNYSIFNNPDLFSLNKKQEIYCISNLKFVFSKTDYEYVFRKFGYYVPPIELINSLFEVIHLRKETGPYWRYFHYKYKNSCSKCIFDHIQSFTYFDGNIFFNDNPSLLKTESNMLLYEKTYKIPVKVNNFYAKKARKKNVLFNKLKQPTLSEFKAIVNHFRSIKPELEEELIKKHDAQVLLQRIIYHLHQNHYSEHMLNEKIASINKEKLPNNFIWQLSQFTNGNINIINQLAMLIAKINLIKSHEKSCSTYIAPKITIITTSNINILKKFFAQLYGEGLKNYKTIHDLCNRKTLLDNILFKHNGGILQICEHNKSANPEDLKILKKFVKGIPVRQRDNAVGNITYISNCHYVVLAKNQEAVTVYKNYFQNLSEVIVLNNSKTEDKTLLEKVNTASQCNTKNQQNTFPNLEEFDYKWVHTIFATYGLLLLTDKKTIQSKKQPSLDLRTVVLSFLKECCKLDPAEYCNAKELYKLYIGYFMKNYGVEPIKRVHLVNILKIDGHYTYCRLRHTAGDYHWGFKGIGIKKEKSEEYNLEKNATSENTPKSDQIELKIANYLSKINEKIRPLIGTE